jgi:hypothetical protein
MKNPIKIIMMLVTAIFSFSACQQDAIDPLEGKYPPPTDYTLTNLFAQNVQKVSGNRVFTLKIASEGLTATFNPVTFGYDFSGTGNYISIDFVGRDYFLSPGAYTIAPNAEAKGGIYVAGYDADFGGGMVFPNWGTCFFDVNNGDQSGLKVNAGQIFVEKSNDNYTITGTLGLENNTFIRINATATIAYVPDIEYTYSIEVVKPYSFTMDGITFTDVAGSQLNKITVKADGAAIAYFEMVTEENPTSYSATYPVKAVNSLERAICQGQYLDLAWFGVSGIPPIESGSYLLDGADKQFMREGNVIITDNNGTLSIIGENIKIQDITTQATFGVLPDARNFEWNNVKPEGGAGGGTHTNLFSASALDLSAFGLSGFTVTLKVATPDLGITAETGAMGTTYTYSGSGQYISFDFSRDAGTLPEGVYNVVDNTTAQVNDCLAGYDSFFGAGFMGTFVGNVVDGVATEEVITGGTVTVTANGFSFDLTTASGAITGSYEGEIVLQ